MLNNSFSLSIQLPPELLDRLKAYQDTQNITSVSNAVVDVLMQFFELGNHPTYASLERLEALESKVAVLTLQVQQLSQLSLQSSSIPPTTNLHISVDDDDIEDEPDEILYAFLPENE